MKYFQHLVLFSSVIFCACGDSSDTVFFPPEGETESRSSTPTQTASTESTATPSVSPAVQSNPVVSTQTFGQRGNLYKPHSDAHGAGGGNLVVLLSSSFRKQFDSCEVRLKSGETRQLRCIDDQPWTQIPFSCFSNGNRQTWRADFGCGSMSEVKVTCRDFNQEVVFTVPSSQRGNVCSRFG